MIKSTRKCWVDPGNKFKCGKTNGNALDTPGCLINPDHELDCYCSEYRFVIKAWHMWHKFDSNQDKVSFSHFSLFQSF